MKKIRSIFTIGLLIMLVNIGNVKADMVRQDIAECKNKNTQCIKCVYRYNNTGLANDIILKNIDTDAGLFSYLVVADGYGDANIETISPIKAQPYILATTIFNNLVVKNDFIVGENNDKQLVCPELAVRVTRNTSRDAVEGDNKTNGYNNSNQYLHITVRKKSDETENEEASFKVSPESAILGNDKPFLSTDAQNSSARSKTCILTSAEIGIDFTLEYNAKNDTIHLETSREAWRDVVTFTYDKIPASKFKEYFGEKECGGVPIYASKKITATGKIIIDVSVEKEGSSYAEMKINGNTSDLYALRSVDGAMEAAFLQECQTILPKDIQIMLQNIFTFIQYLGPILVAVFTIVDLVKAALSGEDDATKKVYNNFSKRIVSAILLFFIPICVSIFFTVLGISAPDICIK